MVTVSATSNQGGKKTPHKNGTFFQIHHKYSEHHCTLKAQLASTQFNSSLLELLPSCAAGISSGAGPTAIPAGHGQAAEPVPTSTAQPAAGR